jgi:excisionase family DNA binding protein
MPLKPLYSLKAFRADFCISPSTLFRMLKAGEIQSHKHGGRTVIKGEEVQRWLDSLPGTQRAA